jgi:hypothetical protein
MTIRPDTDALIAFLNAVVAIDPYAIAELLCIRVPCNRALADHPSVQVAVGGDGCPITYIAPGSFRVGILGILNGYCGNIDDGPLEGWGPIAAIYDEGRLLRFERTETAEFKSPPAVARRETLDG